MIPTTHQHRLWLSLAKWDLGNWLIDDAARLRAQILWAPVLQNLETNFLQSAFQSLDRKQWKNKATWNQQKIATGTFCLTRNENSNWVVDLWRMNDNANGRHQRDRLAWKTGVLFVATCVMLCSVPGAQSLHLKGVFDTNDFFKFLTRFGVQPTDVVRTLSSIPTGFG